MMPDGRFLEVFVDTPIEVCEDRDVKGWYAMARSGEVTSFTGVDDPYEPPQHPELTLHTVDTTVEANATLVLRLLEARGDLAPADMAGVRRPRPPAARRTRPGPRDRAAAGHGRRPARRPVDPTMTLVILPGRRARRRRRAVRRSVAGGAGCAGVPTARCCPAVTATATTPRTCSVACTRRTTR